MRSPQDILQAQLDSLIGTLKQYQAKRTDACLMEARHRAKAIISAAHQRARAQMRAAIDEYRKRLAQHERVLAMRAAHGERLARQQESQAMLMQSRPVVEDALRRRWNNAAARSQWWQAAIDDAAAIILGTDWTLDHPSTLDEARELAEIKKLLKKHGIRGVLSSDPDLEVGLRIRCEGVLMDASLEGLLADYESIGALLLATLTKSGDSRVGGSQR